MHRFVFLCSLFVLNLLPCISWAQQNDLVQCAESEKRIICNLSLHGFIKQVSPILTNGWENTLQIDIALLNHAGDTVLQRSRLEATQRCYLDPFASPCLILWRGAPTWQRYRDETAFLKAMSNFGIQALTLTELPADNYKIRISIKLTASAKKRLESIRTWFKQADSGSDTGFFSNSSFIGSFLSSRAEAMSDDVYEIELETTQFFIDLNFVAPEIEHSLEDSKENTTTEGNAWSSEETYEGE